MAKHKKVKTNTKARKAERPQGPHADEAPPTGGDGLRSQIPYTAPRP